MSSQQKSSGDKSGKKCRTDVLARALQLWDGRPKSQISISPPRPTDTLVLDINTFQNPRPAPKPPGMGAEKRRTEKKRPRDRNFTTRKREHHKVAAARLQLVAKFREQALVRFPNLKDDEVPGRYRFHDVIARGGQGTVHLGTVSKHVEHLGMLVAIKRLDITNCPKPESLLNEIQFLKDNEHDNLVRFVDCHLYRTELWVVLEYMSGD